MGELTDLSWTKEPSETEDKSENEENTPRDEDSEENYENQPAKKPEAPKKQRKKKQKKAVRKHQPVGKVAVKKKVEVKPPSPRISSKSTFAQISKELKARRLAQMAYAAAMAKKRKKNRVLRDEEIYTDKDRAAAVNMGTKDIKQSLKMKKKLDKNDMQIPEEAEPSTLLALGNNEMRSGDLRIALNFMNKALELNPDDKNGLVARSKCYLSLGDPQLALKDAETALQSDKTFVRAIFQKAEALYHLGDFEHSLMYYHRGHRLRPELECFRLGVQKAQEAIENTIGSTATVKSRQSEKNTPSSVSSSSKTIETKENDKSSVTDKSSSESDTKRSSNSEKSVRTGRRRSKSAAPTIKPPSRRFLGELGADREYLENLLKHPDLICSNREAANVIRIQAEEGITFLKSREEFWRQQKPSTTSGKNRKSEDKVQL